MKRNSSKPKRRYGDAGFTLVELVVVIAVLAILAGVGAVAYNGYIDYANKGNDRALVGEIIHALELADYSDSTLFGEDGGAMVVLSKDGIKAAGATVGSDIEGALEDAFGDLESAKLSYDKWDGTPDMSVFASLGGDNSQIKAFLDYVQKPENSASASFAEDMEEYWGDFSTLITLLNSGAATGVDITGNENSIVKLIVDHYKSYDSTKSEQLVSDWKAQKTDPSLSGIALNLATKYAFVSYAKRQTSISADAQKALEDYMAEKKFKTDDYDFMKFTWCTDSDVKTELSNLASTYATSQAEADARAYLGLMEAAAAAQNNLGDTYTDDDFISALDPYVPMVSNVLSGKTDFTAIKTLAETVGKGSVICITAKKENGVLSIKVKPDPADPRDGADGEGSEITSCTEGTHHTALTVGKVLTKIRLKNAGSAIEEGTAVEICSINELPCSITIDSTAVTECSISLSCSDGSVTLSGDASSGYTLTPVHKGTATITITGKINGSEKTGTYTVKVH